MSVSGDNSAVRAVAAAARPLRGAASDYDELLEQIGKARFVLLGEATHGTHEFYAERMRITQRLICELGFDAIAVEADWPDAYRVNCHVRGQGRDASANAALGGFQRFPAWMWRNTDVLALTDWLREHNAGQPASDQVGFYGLDLYSLYTSIAEVLRYLDRIDPAAARTARSATPASSDMTMTARPMPMLPAWACRRHAKAVPSPSCGNCSNTPPTT